jgi:hypothetical protein
MRIFVFLFYYRLPINKRWDCEQLSENSIAPSLLDSGKFPYSLIGAQPPMICAYRAAREEQKGESVSITSAVCRSGLGSLWRVGFRIGMKWTPVDLSLV